MESQAGSGLALRKSCTQCFVIRVQHKQEEIPGFRGIPGLKDKNEGECSVQALPVLPAHALGCTKAPGITHQENPAWLFPASVQPFHAVAEKDIPTSPLENDTDGSQVTQPTPPHCPGVGRARLIFPSLKEEQSNPKVTPDA